jgi:hypothetical protein
MFRSHSSSPALKESIMSIWLIVGITLAILGGILFFVLQIPEVIEKRKKKRREPPPEPPKDWEGIAGRLEKRLQSVENASKAAQNEVLGRDKRIEELNTLLKNLKVQYDQEKIWREKEENVVEKEKKQERLLKEELTRARVSLDQEQTARIKLEGEYKEVRKVREEQAADIRQLNARNMDLDRKLNEALKELKQLRDDNVELKREKNEDQWVAKSDFKRVEDFLKRARWEVEQFKRKIPQDQWPNPLKPRQPGQPLAQAKGQEPVGAGATAEAPATPAAVPLPAENAGPSVPTESVPPEEAQPPSSRSEPTP